MERFAAKRHLALLHRLEQRALDFRRGAVDLVGKNDVGKNWPLRGMVGTVVRVVDQSPCDVRGKQVGSELNAVKARVNCRCQRTHRKCLGQTRNTFEEYVAVGEETDKEP